MSRIPGQVRGQQVRARATLDDGPVLVTVEYHVSATRRGVPTVTHFIASRLQRTT
jgi:hypothetical protein